MLSGDGRHLLVANAESDDVSVFAVSGDGLALTARVPSGGPAPKSVAVHEEHVYVLNTGYPANVTGFTLGAGGELTPLRASHELPGGADPAQVSFSPDGRALVVTDRASNRLLVFAVGPGAQLSAPSAHASSGATPYGFDFTSRGILVVTEAFGGEVGAAAASSYAVDGGSLAPISGSVQNTRSEVCWAVVSKDDRFAFVTNFGDGTISSYAIGDDGRIDLLDAVAAASRHGRPLVTLCYKRGSGRSIAAAPALSACGTNK